MGERMWGREAAPALRQFAQKLQQFRMECRRVAHVRGVAAAGDDDFAARVYTSNEQFGLLLRDQRVLLAPDRQHGCRDPSQPLFVALETDRGNRHEPGHSLGLANDEWQGNAPAEGWRDNHGSRDAQPVEQRPQPRTWE